MTRLDRDVIRNGLGATATQRLATFEAFDEIDSTNSYLMAREAPPPGYARVALTDNQVAGRGRHGRVWHSPRGSGIALSVGYTFAAQPANLSALTLAIGLGVIDALGRAGVEGVLLKWPNDLIADDGKLGGILTETQTLSGGRILVVSGLGLNLELRPDLASSLETAADRRVADLAGFCSEPPRRNELAAHLIDALCETFVNFEAAGFSAFFARWRRSDWLLGRALTVETPRARLSGVGAGIAEDGALLVDTGAARPERITSGSVMVAGQREGVA